MGGRGGPHGIPRHQSRNGELQEASNQRQEIDALSEFPSRTRTEGGNDGSQSQLLFDAMATTD